MRALVVGVIGALFATACRTSAPFPADPRVPSLAAVEKTSPIRWSLPDPRPIQGPIQTTPLTMIVDGDALTITSTAGPSVRVTTGLKAPIKGGMSLDRGFAKRVVHRDQTTERWVELFRGSRIASIFRRITLGDRPVAIADLGFSFDASLSRFVRVHPGRLESVTGNVDLAADSVRRPFVAVTDDGDQQGIVFFFPHHPEVRRWYVEDYVVTLTPTAHLKTRAGELSVSFDPIVVPAEEHATFDFPVYVMPYRGSLEDALAAFDVGPVAADRSYWDPRPDETWGNAYSHLRMLRYNPSEFASFADSSKHVYGHPGGFAWGNMTRTMKGIRTQPLAYADLLRDQAFRMLTFFVEAGRDKGAPPNLVMNPRWTTQLERPEQIRSVVFCQYWEYRLAEFAQQFDSPYLTAPEKRRIYDELQRARVVLDPTANRFTSETENGGLWFDYLDMPIASTKWWVVNTHTTMTANVGEFALLARRFGEAEDERYWIELFRRATKGLLWAVQQSWMWRDDDPNELAYSKGGNGSREYHVHMVQDWTPRVARLAIALAPDLAPDVIAFEKKIASAEIIQERDSAREFAHSMIDALERELRDR